MMISPLSSSSALDFFWRYLPDELVLPHLAGPVFFDGTPGNGLRWNKRNLWRSHTTTSAGSPSTLLPCRNRRSETEYRRSSPVRRKRNRRSYCSARAILGEP